MTNTVVQIGDSYRIFGSSFKAHPSLPRGTYRVDYDELSGHSLTAISDIPCGTEKMYGNGKSRIDRILRGYEKMNRSYGILLSGSGGMGKTMLARELVNAASLKFDIPVVVVDSDSPNIAQFIDSLGPCIVFFDEFEKTFNYDYADELKDSQAQFLSLFDGISSTKRMYVVTVNELKNLNKYFVNRTGRFHAHLRFDYPSSEDIRDYLRDAGVEESEIDKVVSFSLRVNINYDHLRAIAFELVEVGGSFDDIISDLNIKALSDVDYRVSVAFVDGSKKDFTATMNFNHKTGLVEGNFPRGTLSFKEEHVSREESTGILHVDGAYVDLHMYFDNNFPKVDHVTYCIAREPNISY